jgi:iron complex transport system substrate-binding protein
VRIVSLLPSSTEILFALGAGDDVVGVSFECDFPAEARQRRVVSLTTMPADLSPGEIDAFVRTRIAAGDDLYRLDRDALRDLDPDLVVTQDLCAVCALDLSSVDAAMNYLGCTGKVITLDPHRLDDVLNSIVVLGASIGRAAHAEHITAQLRDRLAAVESVAAGRPRPRVALLEWTDPPFNAGHWVPDLVAAAGGDPVLGTAGERSVAIDWADVARSEPDVIVVAPCGYHLDATHDLATGLVDAGVLPPDVPVWAVDADAMFVRPGPRLVDGVEALAAVCHPELFAARPDVARQVSRISRPSLTDPVLSALPPTQ